MVGGAPSTSVYGTISGFAWEVFFRRRYDQRDFIHPGTLAVWQQVLLAVVAWYALAILIVRFCSTDKQKEEPYDLILLWGFSPLLVVIYGVGLGVFVLLKALGAKITFSKFFD